MLVLYFYGMRIFSRWRRRRTDRFHEAMKAAFWEIPLAGSLRSGVPGKGGGQPFLCLPVALCFFLCPCASDVAALSFSEGKDGGFSAGRGANKAHECDSRRTGRGMGRWKLAYVLKKSSWQNPDPALCFLQASESNIDKRWTRKRLLLILQRAGGRWKPVDEGILLVTRELFCRI